MGVLGESVVGENFDSSAFVEVSIPGMERWPELPRRCRALRSRGHHVLVLATAEGAEHFRECADEVVICPNVYAPDELVAALTPYASQPLRFSIISDKVWTAQLTAARRLGMHLPGARGQANCRIKVLTREKLRDSLPLTTELLNADEADGSRVDAAVGRVGVPFVIKPIWGAASAYVEVVKDRSQAHAKVTETFAALREDPNLGPFDDGDRRWDAREQLLLEEFAEGREFSLEGFIQAGRLTTLMVQEKIRWTESDGLRFETANLSPTPFLDAHEVESMRETLERALRELELDDTLVHIEYKWDGDLLNVIEVNPRMGGGSVPKMLQAWQGADVREMMLDLMTGRPLAREYPGREGFLLGVFVNAHQSGVYREMEGLEWVRSRPEFCFDQMYMEPGSYIPPRGGKAGREAWMYCYDVFFQCENASRIDELHDETLERVRLRFEGSA